MSDIMQEVLAILKQRQGAVDQQAANVRRAAAPINTQFANPGQSFGDVLTNGTGAQRQALIQMAAEMGRDSSRVPGAALASGAARGFELLNQIRGQQREQNIGQAQAALNTAIEDRSAAKGYMDTASQLEHAFGEKTPEAPKPTNDMVEYEYAKKGGYTGTFEEWLNRDNVAKQNAATAKGEAEQQKLLGMQRSAAENTLQTSQITLNSIEKAMKQAEGWFSTGLAGQTLQDLGGTKAHDLKKTITQIVSTVGFDRLQRMRDESPTGGALGQVSQMELAQLNSALGNLEVSQSEEQLKENLQVVKEVYYKILGEMNSFLASTNPDLDPNTLEGRMAEYL